MAKDIRREFLLNLDSLALLLGIEAAGWLGGLILGVFLTMREGELFILGRIFGLVSLVVAAVLVPMVCFSGGYEQALQMGCTRRRFLTGITGALLAQGVCGLALLAVLWEAERLIGMLLLGARYEEGKMTQCLPWLLAHLWIVPAALAATVCLGAFCGACLHRWGRAALWTAWCAGVLLLLLGNLPVGVGTPLGRFLAPLRRRLAAVTPAGWAIAGGLAAAALGAAGMALLLHDRVRSAT